MTLLDILESIALLVTVVTSFVALVRSHKTVLRLNYLAFCIGSGILFYSEALNKSGLVQVGLIVLVSAIAGLLPSLRQLEKLWILKI